MSISISEDALLTALRGFLLTIITGEVIQSQGNRVPMPQGDFCTMTPLFLTGLSTDRSTYIDLGINPSTQSHTRSTQWTCQLDFYGPLAGDNAATVATLIRTEAACDYFLASGVDMQPLYADDPKQGPLINGEGQYETRWTLSFIAQCNPVVQTPADLATQLTVTTVDVTATYP